MLSRKVNPNQIISPELARQMSEISHETGKQIGALINRKGQVEYVMVGDAKKIYMPDFKRVRVGHDRFRGLRCVHTHLRGEDLTQDDLTDLALLRLDLIAAIEVNPKTGLPDMVHAAHLLPEAPNTPTNSDTPFGFLESAPPSQMEDEFLELIESLENEMARVRQTARSRQTTRERAILINVAESNDVESEESIEELRELATSANVLVIDEVIQKRSKIDPKTVLGRGKLEEILIGSMQKGADLLIFDRELSPAQVKALTDATDLKVIDRSQLILDIFAQRAQSREGKLQVELAQLKYLLPRLVIGKESAFSRLAGGIGGRGPGETKLETDRRRVRDRINSLEKQVDNLQYQRQERRKTRLQKHLPIISLVGYTNAGKSTLLNSLTNSDVFAEQKMFATLDPTSRRLRLPIEQEVIINDTVGFIRDLPEALVAAFRATLDEITDSDLLVHVVDASNPRAIQQIESVETILNDLKLLQKEQIIVLNKSDLLGDDDLTTLRRQIERQFDLEIYKVSAIQRKSLANLVVRIGDFSTEYFTFEDSAAA